MLKEELSKLTECIYTASALFEELEHEGKIFGNGHHLRQNLAAIAELLLLCRWENKDEVLEIIKEKRMFLNTDLSNLTFIYSKIKELEREITLDN